MKQVTITVDAIGGIKMDAAGFTGNTCDDATKVFAQAFAGVQTDREDKPEYFQPVVQNDSVRM